MRLAALLPALLLAGCASVGPATVAHDRIEYVHALSDSWKRQMLLNLVKVRYHDVPLFLDVTSVINAYTLDTDVRGALQAAPVNRGDTFLGISGGTRYSDHPTISYVPLTGDKFAKAIMSPIPVSGILLLVQSGYPADAVLRFGLSSINGLANARGTQEDRRSDAGFVELIALLRAEQLAGGLGFESKTQAGRNPTILRLHPPVDGAMAQRHRRIRELLKLKPGASEYEMGFGSFPAGETDVALLSRSILQVMLDVASFIEAPPGDVAAGRVAPARVDPALRPPVRVQASETAPQEAFVAVRYRGMWFWVDDRDQHSKTSFSFLMLMFSLTETSAAQAAPVVTVPVR